MALRDSWAWEGGTQNRVPNGAMGTQEGAWFLTVPTSGGLSVQGGPLGKTSLGEVCTPCVGPEHPQPPPRGPGFGILNI